MTFQSCLFQFDGVTSAVNKSWQTVLFFFLYLLHKHLQEKFTKFRLYIESFLQYTFIGGSNTRHLLWKLLLFHNCTYWIKLSIRKKKKRSPFKKFLYLLISVMILKLQNIVCIGCAKIWLTPKCLEKYNSVVELLRRFSSDYFIHAYMHIALQIDAFYR